MRSNNAYSQSYLYTDVSMGERKAVIDVASVHADSRPGVATVAILITSRQLVGSETTQSP
jgi:ribosomal protein S3